MTKPKQVVKVDPPDHTRPDPRTSKAPPQCRHFDGADRCTLDVGHEMMGSNHSVIIATDPWQRKCWDEWGSWILNGKSHYQQTGIKFDQQQLLIG